MSDNNGCQALAALFVVGGLIVIGIWGLSKLEDSQAQRYRARAELTVARGQAEAAVIRAQGQARIDAAQAQSLTMLAALPYLLALFAVVALALILMALVSGVVLLLNRKPMVHRIETRVVLLPPGASRREAWQLLSSDQAEKPMIVEVVR